MPIAAPEPVASGLQENIVGFLLLSLSFAIVAVSAIVLWGLRRLPGEVRQG
jgi:hypothetical protein